MKVRVAKWGNSLAVRLPSRLAAELGLNPGRIVEVTRVGGKLELEPEKERPRTKFISIEEIVAEMDRLGPENEPETVDWGPDRGSEIIYDEYNPEPKRTRGG